MAIGASPAGAREVHGAGLVQHLGQRGLLVQPEDHRARRHDVARSQGAAVDEAAQDARLGGVDGAARFREARHGRDLGARDGRSGLAPALDGHGDQVAEPHQRQHELDHGGQHVGHGDDEALPVDRAQRLGDELREHQDEERQHGAGRAGRLWREDDGRRGWWRDARAGRT